MEGDKFTPGPWRFDDAGPLSGNIIRFDILAGPETDPFRVCEVDDSVPDICAMNTRSRSAAAKRDLANARLIAAAPDLLEACRKAMTCASMDSSVREVIRAAIAKATGG